MNKLFTKIAALALGAAMAVGVGVAVSSKANDVKPAEAASATWNKISADPVSGTAYVIVSSDGNQLFDGSQGTIDSTSNHIAGTYGDSITGDYDGKSFTFTKSGSDWYIQSAAGTYIGRSSNSNGITTATTTGNSVKNTITRSNSAFTIKGTASRYLSYNTSSGRFRYFASGTVFLYEKSAKTLSSISLSGTYPTSFTTGDAFDHTGLVVTAHYSDSTTANVSSSATFSGYNMSTAGNQTVTVSYTEGGTTKTATYSITVVAPTTPTLSLDKASFSGYTGQSFSVTATYANLESDLAWSASGTGSITGGDITWSSSDHRNGTSTYTCTLSGEGSKTIVADADGVDAQQCGITITQTTVNITKASTSIPVGRSETLAASHNASSVGGLNWTSSDNSIATVGSDGKVTVDSNATVGDTVTITATSSVDTNVSDTCTVTVDAAPLDTTYDFVTNFSSYNDGWSNSYGTHTGIDGKTQVGGDYAATIDLYYASKQGSTITDRPVFASKTASGSWTKVVGFTLTEPGYKISDVSVTFAQWTTKTPDIALFSGDEASGTPLDSGTIGTKNTISTTGLNDTEFTVGYCDKNTGSNVQSGLTSIYITLVRENALDHVTVSFASDPADRTFYAGSNFAFNGTLTASYTVDAAKAVTPSGYFLEGEEGSGEQITTSTILTVADHNGGDVYVQYKEGGVTKYDTFTLIVNPAPATSVTLSANVDSVALEEVFEVSSITATVNPEDYATQGVTWDIYDLGGLTSSDYAFDNGEFMASKPADVVFHVKANSNNSVYATFTLTITGDPIAHLLDGELADVTDGSTTVFADAGVLTYGITTENFEGTITYGWSTSSSATIAINDDQGDTCDFLVKAAGSARLSCRVQGSTKGDVTVYIDVTVSAVTVTSVTWTTPTIDVFSGASMSTASWNVRYSTNSGKTDQVPDSYKIFLGDTEIASNHTWTADDDGETLKVKVGNVYSSSTTVKVTQTIHSVVAQIPGTPISEYQLVESQSDLEEGRYLIVSIEDAKAFDGSLDTLDAGRNNFDVTISDGTVIANDSTASGKYFDLTVENDAWTITSASGANVGHSASGNGMNGTGTNTITVSDGISTILGTGGKGLAYNSASGATSERFRYYTSPAANANHSVSLFKLVEEPGTPTSVEIANVATHKEAQRVAVKFAKSFNAAMDLTENCTTGLDAAWSTCSSAYNTFKTEAAALGSEKAYAEYYIKYASCEWSDDSGEACIERMLRTYKACVQVHGKTAFMSELVSLGRVVTPVNAISNSGTEVAIIVVTSMIGLSAVGGYFFLRKRKENI